MMFSSWWRPNALMLLRSICNMLEMFVLSRMMVAWIEFRTDMFAKCDQKYTSHPHSTLHPTSPFAEPDNSVDSDVEASGLID